MKRLFLVLSILGTLLLLSFGMVGAQDDGPETIRIGATVPLTGRYAGGGAQVQRGYQIGVDDINAAGGVMVEEYGRQIPLELVLLDDESDPVKTVSNLEDLYANDDVVVYLGGFGSDLHAAAAAVAEVNAVPYLGVAFALWDAHQQGYEYLFSPFPKSPDLSRTMFEFLNATLAEADRPLRVGILQESTDWGIELVGFWEADAAEFGYEVVAHEQYAPGTTDFSNLILAMRDADVQLLLTLPNPPDGLTLFTQMAELNWTPAHSLVIRAPDPPTWGQNLGVVGDFVSSMPGWHNAMAFEGVEHLNEVHIEMMERPADPIVGPSYALIQILAAAIEEAGTLDRDAIRDAIAATDMETVIGPVTFNEDGTGNVVTAILQMQNGRQQLIWPAEFATAEFAFPALPYADREVPMEATEEATEASGN
jgi:branched-chain amino acid transport system substrate-binding protein